MAGAKGRFTPPPGIRLWCSEVDLDNGGDSSQGGCSQGQIVGPIRAVGYGTPDQIRTIDRHCHIDVSISISKESGFSNSSLGNGAFENAVCVHNRCSQPVGGRIWTSKGTKASGRDDATATNREHADVGIGAG